MSFKKPSPEGMRAEFHRLCTIRDEIEAKAAPARAAHDAKRVELMELEQKELKPLQDAMFFAEKGLYEVKQDIAELSRWLKGKTGNF